MANITLGHTPYYTLFFVSCRLLIPAIYNLEEFFVSVWKIFYKLESMSKTFSLISTVEHKDPICECILHTCIYDH